MATRRRDFLREAVLGPADLASRGTRPARTSLDLLFTGDGGTRLDVSVIADTRAGQQRGTGTDAGVLANSDLADVDDITIDQYPDRSTSGSIEQ